MLTLTDLFSSRHLSNNDGHKLLSHSVYSNKALNDGGLNFEVQHFRVLYGLSRRLRSRDRWFLTS